MTKTAKKVVSIALALLMLLPLSINAFAAVSQAEAEDIALAAVNVKREDAAAIVTEFDYELGSLYKYDIDIYVKGVDGSFTEYDVEVKASDGRVLSKSTKVTPAAPPVAEGDIGQEKAKQNALEAFGVLEGSISRYTIKKDFENGRFVYEIEFYVDRDEYSCKVDCATGQVIELEIDQNEVSNGFFARIARFFEMIFAWFRNLFQK